MGGSKYNHKDVQPLLYSILEYFHYLPEKPGSVPGSCRTTVPSTQATTLLFADGDSETPTFMLSQSWKKTKQKQEEKVFRYRKARCEIAMSFQL